MFDGGALEAIVSSDDNNKRAEALEVFVENVLPHYDDVQNEYAHISERLIEAVKVARATPLAPIETPYGPLPAKTAADIVELVAGVLETYRYADVDVTFGAVCELFAGAESDAEREPLLRLADSLSKHQLEIWRTHGPAVQAMVVDRIDGLPIGKRGPLLRLLTRMLGEVLEAEITGASSSSTSITMHFGPVPVSVDLGTIRGQAMELLKALMQLATSDGERRTILNALENATRGPRTDDLPADLAKLLIDNTKEFIEYLTEIAPTLGYEILQTCEDRARWMYIHNRSLPEALASDAVLVEARDRLVAAIFAFRDAINCDRAFVIYKTLVGFESVFPPAWDDPTFDIEEADRYRAEQVEALLGEIDEADGDQWFEVLSRCARTDS